MAIKLTQEKKIATKMEKIGAIWVLPFHGQGHMLPTIELCNRLASRSFKIKFIMSTQISSSVPPSLIENPSIEILFLPSSAPPPPPPPESVGHHNPLELHLPADHKDPFGNNQMIDELEKLIKTQLQKSETILLECVIVDVMMSWSRQAFEKFKMPVIGFFTSGACSAAMEYAVWKEQLSGDFESAGIHLLPSLPDELALSGADLKKRSRGPPRGPDRPTSRPRDIHGPPRGHPPPPFDGMKKAPPQLGQQPPWLEETKECVALLINTCREVEGRFLDYLAQQIGKPVWGAGPLLPDKYLSPDRSALHDQEIRGTRQTNVNENDVAQWLDRRPNGSVLYVSFGTEVGPRREELTLLAEALESSKVSFIWVIQNSRRPIGGPISDPDSEEEEDVLPQGFEERIGDGGMIIRGWAPQLLILRHPSTGGFLSHCGWNSVMEAVCGGVPILAWPIRGDQFFNSDLVVKYLGVGYAINDDGSTMDQKAEIVKGIEKVIGNGEVKKRSVELSRKLENGYSRSSEECLDVMRSMFY